MEEALPASSQSAVPPPEMSEWKRILSVFTNPKPAFVDIAAQPRWWPPLVLLIAVSVIFLFAFSQRVGWDRFMRQTMENNPRVQNLPAQDRERLIERQTRVVANFSYVGAALGTVVYVLAAAAVLLFVFKLVLGAALNFRQVFAITSYAFLPGVIGGLVALLVMFLKSPDDFNLQRPTVFNVGAFLDPQATSRALLVFATSIDLFTIWTILLLATGLSVASRRLSWGKSLAGVAIPWLVWVGIKSVWAGMFG